MFFLKLVKQWTIINPTDSVQVQGKLTGRIPFHAKNNAFHAIYLALIRSRLKILVIAADKNGVNNCRNDFIKKKLLVRT